MKYGLLLFLCLISFSLTNGYEIESIKVIDLYDYLPTSSDHEYKERELEQIKGVILHHEGGNSGSLWSIAEMHIARGFPGISYHYAINYRGDVFRLLPLTTLSYHAKGFNTNSIGIVMLGNFEDSEPTGASLKSLEALIISLNLSLPIEFIQYHGQTKATLCPGANLIDELETRRLLK